jgi:hypothetical protein
MTITEIEKAFPDEWVLIAEPALDASQRVLAGRVVAHSVERDAVHREARASAERTIAILYTGDPLKDVAGVLL